MGIAQQIRAMLGIGSELPDSAVFTQALGDKLQEVNRLDADIPAREQRLPLDVIQDADGGDAASRELADLKSKRERLAATCDLLRRELATAREREADAQKIFEFEAAAEKARACAPLVKDLVKAIVPAAEAARALLDAHAKYVGAIPDSTIYERHGRWVSLLRPSAYLCGYSSTGGARDGDLVRELIVSALENPHTIEDRIARSVEICMENVAEIRAGAQNPQEDEAASPAASNEEPKRGEAASKIF